MSLLIPITPSPLPPLTSPSLSVGIRRSAFEKLAGLAVNHSTRGNESELSRLSQQARSNRQPDGTLNGVLKEQSPTSRVPMVRIYQFPRGGLYIFT